MNDAGWIDIWHIAGAMLARQTPFVQIFAVTLAALFVVMAIEGFRTSIVAIRRGNRAVATVAPPSVTGAAEALAPPAAKSFSLRPVVRASAKRKALTAIPRQFRSPRPTIRRHPAPAPDILAAPPQYASDTPGEISARL